VPEAGVAVEGDVALLGGDGPGGLLSAAGGHLGLLEGVGVACVLADVLRLHVEVGLDHEDLAVLEPAEHGHEVELGLLGLQEVALPHGPDIAPEHHPAGLAVVAGVVAAQGVHPVGEGAGPLGLDVFGVVVRGDAVRREGPAALFVRRGRLGREGQVRPLGVEALLVHGGLVAEEQPRLPRREAEQRGERQEDREQPLFQSSLGFSGTGRPCPGSAARSPSRLPPGR
jgi:hypothetical protein